MFNTGGRQTRRERRLSIPDDVLRFIFELALEPYPSTVSASLLCLCSTVTAWLEPLLYEEVILPQARSFRPFIEALRSPSRRFPTQHVRKLWLLSHFPPYTGGLKYITQRCPSLEELVCHSNWLSGPNAHKDLIRNDAHTALRKLYVLNTNLRLECLSPAPLCLLTHLYVSEFSRMQHGTLQNLVLPNAEKLTSLTHVCMEVRLTYQLSDFETIMAGYQIIKQLLETVPSLCIITLRVKHGLESLPDPLAFERTRKFFESGVTDISLRKGQRARIIVESESLSGDFTIEELLDVCGRRIMGLSWPEVQA